MVVPSDTSAGSGTALVVGGTRILAPAVQRLHEHGWAVSVVTRDPEWRPTAARGVTPLVADVTCRDGWRRALTAARPPTGAWDLAVAYQPFGDDGSWRTLAAAVSGRLVAVLTSDAATPGRTDAALPDLPGAADLAVLVLGWRDAPDPGWHTPDEISAAALEIAQRDDIQPEVDALPALAGRSLVAGAVLGRVRPWGSRPS